MSMRTSHFAAIQVVVPPDTYQPDGTSQTAVLKTVGMAQGLSIDDNFGTRGENTLGTPLPVLAPGYLQTTVNIEKATIDGADFRNLGAFNPLWGHVGRTYQSPVTIPDSQGAPMGIVGGSNGTDMFPFMFVVAVKNRVANSYTKSSITYDNLPATGPTDPKARVNTIGLYVCVLQSASINLNSNQALIMDRVNAIARPVAGTWLSQAVRDAYAHQSGGRNGMADLVYDIMWGYNS